MFRNQKRSFFKSNLTEDLRCKASFGFVLSLSVVFLQPCLQNDVSKHDQKITSESLDVMVKAHIPYHIQIFRLRHPKNAIRVPYEACKEYSLTFRCSIHSNVMPWMIINNELYSWKVPKKVLILNLSPWRGSQRSFGGNRTRKQ